MELLINTYYVKDYFFLEIVLSRKRRIYLEGKCVSVPLITLSFNIKLKVNLPSSSVTFGAVVTEKKTHRND